MANYGTKIGIYGSRKYAQSGIKRERVKDKITKIPYNYRIVKKKMTIDNNPYRFGYIVYASKRRKK
jgi:hypothetical protein